MSLFNSTMHCPKITKNSNFQNVQKSSQLKHHLCRGNYILGPNMTIDELQDVSGEIGQSFITAICTVGQKQLVTHR